MLDVLKKISHIRGWTILSIDQKLYLGEFAADVGQSIGHVS